MMKMKKNILPKLSVIIPVFNAEEFLCRAIDSVCASTLQGVEIIVIDDASSGACRQIVQNYPGVKYIRHEENKGLFAARVTGIRHAQGTYIAHLDPDDWVEPAIYEKACDKAFGDDLDMVLFNVMQEDESHRRWIEPRNVLYPFAGRSGLQILEQIFVLEADSWIWHVCWNKIIKRDIALKALRYIKEGRHLVMYEDLLWSTLLFTQLQNSRAIAAIEDIGLSYFRHGEAITHQLSAAAAAKKFDDTVYVLAEIEKIFTMQAFGQLYLEYFRKTKQKLFSMYLPTLPQDYFDTKELLHGEIEHFLHTYDKGQSDLLVMEYGAKRIVAKAMAQKTKEIVIFGIGDFARQILLQAQKNALHVKAFAVSNKSKEQFCSLGVYTIEDALQEGCRDFAVASFGSFYQIQELLKIQAQRYGDIAVYGFFE
jgi:glycosyltransferase involved in cell wall biosynthesis